MVSAASGAVAATRALDHLVRNERGRLTAALIARLGNFQLAEDSLQDAMVSAVSHWGRNGVPHSPQGWLLQVAYRKAIDRIRHDRSQARTVSALKPLLGEETGVEPHAIPDERLRLIFTCCHPALERKSQVALTLRTIAGLSTAEIAAVFLDSETTMRQRLSRAKTKIAAAGIPFAVPQAEDWPSRLQAVLAVIYLVFTSGYAAGPTEARDLATEAIYLMRMLDRLRPDEAEIEGCQALLLITHGRRAARLDTNGVTVPLGEQDRQLWDRPMIEEGLSLVARAMARRTPGPYQIKAAIAACHVQAERSDWPQIALLYDELWRLEPTPVVRLNRAVALAETGLFDLALQETGMVAGELDQYQPFHAAHADLLARTGQTAPALLAYARAIELSGSEADRNWLRQRCMQLRQRV